MSKKLLIAIAVWVVYSAILLLLPKLFSSGGHLTHSDFVSSGLSPSHFLAVVFLVAFVLIWGWVRDVGLKLPRPGTSYLFLWFPALFIAMFFALGIGVGFKSGFGLLFAVANTLAVGFGEELAFRGILFAGARGQFRTWGAIIFSTVIFGSIHVLNGFGTGDFLGAGVQAAAATLSGFLYIAILIRTGSLIPGMIVHFLWDLGIFITSSGPPGPVDGGDVVSTGLGKVLMPIVFVLPTFLYSLWLIRGVGNLPEGEVV